MPPCPGGDSGFDPSPYNHFFVNRIIKRRVLRSVSAVGNKTKTLTNNPIQDSTKPHLFDTSKNSSWVQWIKWEPTDVKGQGQVIVKLKKSRIHYNCLERSWDKFVLLTNPELRPGNGVGSLLKKFGWIKRGQGAKY